MLLQAIFNKILKKSLRGKLLSGLGAVIIKIKFTTPGFSAWLCGFHRVFAFWLSNWHSLAIL